MVDKEIVKQAFGIWKEKRENCDVSQLLFEDFWLHVELVEAVVKKFEIKFTAKMVKGQVKCPIEELKFKIDFEILPNREGLLDGCNTPDMME